MVAKLTVGSGAVTVTPADPLTVSLVAVIVTCWASARTPVTSPVPETVAMAGLLLAHVTTRSVSTLPLASFTVAASRTVFPTVRLVAVGATATDATAGGDAGAVESEPQPASARPRTAANHQTFDTLRCMSPPGLVVRISHSAARRRRRRDGRRRERHEAGCRRTQLHDDRVPRARSRAGRSARRTPPVAARVYGRRHVRPHAEPGLGVPGDVVEPHLSDDWRGARQLGSPPRRPRPTPAGPVASSPL